VAAEMTTKGKTMQKTKPDQNLAAGCGSTAHSALANNSLWTLKRKSIKTMSYAFRSSPQFRDKANGADLLVRQKAVQQRRPAMPMRQCCFDLPY